MVSLRDHLDVPRRRWRLVASVFAGVFACALAAALLLPKRYVSGTLILVERESAPESVVPKVTPEDRSKSLLTIRQQLLSRTHLETILKELDPYPADMRREPLSTVVEELRTAIHLTVKGNDAFTIEYQHRDPRMAMRVTDRLAALFIADSNRTQEEQATAAYQFLDSELQRARQELEAKERALRDYKEKHIGVLPEQTAASLALMQRLQQEQQAVSTALQAALDRQSTLAIARAPAPESTLGAQLAAEEADLAALRARYTEEHPDVRAARARVERTRRQLADAEAAGPTPAAPADPLGPDHLEVASLRERSRAIDKRIAELQAQVDEAPRSEQDLATLTRDFDKLNENYASLLSKKMDAQMARKLEQRWKGERFRVLDPAYLPDRPSFPNVPLFALAGLVAGAILGVGAAFVIEDFDHTVKRADELAALLPYPVVGVIGRIELPPSAAAADAAASPAV
jgi:protein tyrosine kinase modulator